MCFASAYNTSWIPPAIVNNVSSLAGLGWGGRESNGWIDRLTVNRGRLGTERARMCRSPKTHLEASEDSCRCCQYHAAESVRSFISRRIESTKEIREGFVWWP